MTSKSHLAHSGKLLRILGIGFGVAVSIGATIGVGILRSPGLIAEQINSAWLIMMAWTLGGVYVLLVANNVAELASMTPRAGGFYVYANRAYGGYGGFVVGWSDWLANTLGLSFISVVFGEYAAALFAPDLSGGRVFFSVGILLLLTILNWLGLRTGSATQKLTSFLKAVMLLAFVAACFAFGGNNGAGKAAQNAASPKTGFALVVAFVLSLQLILSTYDGWFTPIYFAEEDRNPKQNLPRSLFGGIALIIIIYLLINAALLYALPFEKLAGAKFAGAEAMSVIFGGRSGQFVTILALLSLIGILNAILMANPRILLALGRDGLFTAKAAQVNAGGTPVFALAATALATIVLTSIGTFEKLLAVAQFLIVTWTILLAISLFVLRRREPDAPRPFRAFAYPFAPLLVLLVAVLLFVGYIVSNPLPSLYALAVLAASYPIYRLVKR